MLGGLVLIALGVQAWRTARHDHLDGFGAALTAPVPRGRGPRAAFRASLVSVAGNPKAAVFGISFFPQFLPRSGPVIPTLLVLAVIQVIVDTSWCISFVLLAGRVGRVLSRTAIRRRVERALAAVLIGLGVELAADTR